RETCNRIARRPPQRSYRRHGAERVKRRIGLAAGEFRPCSQAVAAHLGSARVSRAGERVLAIANFLQGLPTPIVCRERERLVRRDAETSTRDACVPWNSIDLPLDQLHSCAVA